MLYWGGSIIINTYIMNYQIISYKFQWVGVNQDFLSRARNLSQTDDPAGVEIADDSDNSR